MADKILDSTGLAHLVTKIKEGISEKSKVSVSETGTSTNKAKFITVDGTEYIMALAQHTLTGIGVVTLPKTEYTAGEKIDVTGIVVNALYADNDNVDITSECIYSPSVDTVIYEDTTEIIVSWINDGITYTTNIPITVTRVLSEITVTQVPNKVEYKVNEEALDLTGMIISAIYSSGKSEVVTNYTTDPVEGTIFTEIGNVTLTITYTENEITKTVTTSIMAKSSLALVDWATGTDEEIVAMVEAADNGDIDLSDYWAIGDERVVTLSAMSATYATETHAQQDVTFVLTSAGNKYLEKATASGRDTCSFTVSLKDCLNEVGWMQTTSSSSSVNTVWPTNCQRKSWCNNVFYYAIPSTLRPIFKRFKVVTASSYSQSSGVTSTYDYFTLPAYKEITGNQGYSIPKEYQALSQFTYYKNSSSNIQKKINGSVGEYFTRSVSANSTVYYVTIKDDGSTNTTEYAYYKYGNGYGIAPYGVI